MRATLTAAERRKLDAFVKEHGGVKPAAAVVGCNRATLTSALAGMQIQAGTAALIRLKLADVQADNGTTAATTKKGR